MASVSALECEARSCQVGASLGFIARLLAEVRRLLDDLRTLRPAYRGRERGREGESGGGRKGRRGEGRRGGEGEGEEGRGEERGGR